MMSIDLLEARAMAEFEWMVREREQQFIDSFMAHGHRREEALALIEANRPRITVARYSVLAKVRKIVREIQVMQG